MPKRKGYASTQGAMPQPLAEVSTLEHPLCAFVQLYYACMPDACMCYACIYA